MHKRNSYGYTLMEMIIALIIMGALAALAISKLKNVVEYSRSAEAKQHIGTIRHAWDRCMLISRQDWLSCDELSELDIEDPNDSIGGIFTYAMDNDVDLLQIIATRSATDGSPHAGETIKLRVLDDPGILHEIKWEGTGPYEPINDSTTVGL